MNKTIEKLYKKLIELNCSDTEIFRLIETINFKLELSEKIEKCLYDSELYLVYKHTDPMGKIYIGITQNHPQTRWNEGGGYEKQYKFYKAIQKYGWIHFKHEILEAGLSKDEALKLENELIIATKSYDEQYGYNTRVNLEDKQLPEIQSKSKFARRKSKKTNKSTQNIFDIAREISDKYSIKTISDKIYYLKDNKYVPEERFPIIEFELVANYQILTKEHKEIIKQIKIITHATISELSGEERKVIFPKAPEKTDDVFIWISENDLTLNDLLDIPTADMYTMFSSWCQNHGINNFLGKKQFFKFIQENYHFGKKQKSDGKRYFVELN